MAAYFTSDVHLRPDRADRGRRFAQFVQSLNHGDSLTIVGDLCDFWFATRQRNSNPLGCEGLRALVDYRNRGGALTILLGNHDTWLGSFYTETLGARIVPEPHVLEVSGLRLHLVHGHRLGARSTWKAGMESRAFFRTFSALPNRVASGLDRALDRKNLGQRVEDETRHLQRYRAYVHSLSPGPDLVIFGHVHRPVDEPGEPRVLVLGSWHERGFFLRIENGEAHFLPFVGEGPRDSSSRLDTPS